MPIPNPDRSNSRPAWFCPPERVLGPHRTCLVARGFSRAENGRVDFPGHSSSTPVRKLHPGQVGRRSTRRNPSPFEGQERLGATTEPALLYRPLLRLCPGRQASADSRHFPRPPTNLLSALRPV